MRLTLVISSLEAGGAERVMSALANHWAGAGWVVTLITFDDGSVSPFYKLDQRVNHVPMAVARPSKNMWVAAINNLRRVLKLRKKIVKSAPDAVISFMDATNILTILATRGTGVTTVVSERTDTRLHDIGVVWRMLRTIVYKFADMIVFPSVASMSRFGSGVESKSVVIPNPVFGPNGQATPTVRINGPTVMAMGRLVDVKGFDLLLEAFAKIKDDYDNWSLTILGDGPRRGHLESMVSRLGLAGRVSMPGMVKNTADYLARADLFVLSSRYEGFPNALCEAMACGVAVISFDCMSGPREIISDGVDGVLAPAGDVEKLSSAMAKLMGDKNERERLALNARRIVERYGMDKVSAMWESLLTGGPGV